MQSLPCLKIFVSSPGDVPDEREAASRVIARLTMEYSGRAAIAPYVWEHEPLVATETFQTQIIRPGDCQIVVCILWSRIGTRLPGSFCRPDGTHYESGTEFEFEDARRARQETGEPDLLVYRKTARRSADLDAPDLAERIRQKDRLDDFLSRWFKDPVDGTALAALHRFPTVTAFETLLETHLRSCIQRRVAGTAATQTPPSWNTALLGSPFRGLLPFDSSHASVFFGRATASRAVLDCVAAQLRAGTAFLLVTGASGVGKSSLLRAGVLPRLSQFGVIEENRFLGPVIFTPNEGSNPIEALVAGLLRLWPRLAPDQETRQRLLARMTVEPGTLVERIHSEVRRQELRNGNVRLLILVDQLEEIFGADVSPQDVVTFSRVIAALAHSEVACILASLRSDFYPHLAAITDLMALKTGTGLHDLSPPTLAEIEDIVRLPARAAGLKYETRDGHGLDEILCAAAVARPENLPLLQFALSELYDQRDPATGTLTFAAYQAMGGLEGALTRHAEDVFLRLPADAQQALPHVLRRLVTVRPEADGRPMRRPAPRDAFRRAAGAQTLVERLIQARLLLADGQEDDASVLLTHEALLTGWPRLAEWLRQDFERLRAHGRLASAAQRWRAEGMRRDLLLAEGKQLSDAQDLVIDRPGELSPAEHEFVAASVRRSRSQKRLRVGAVTALALLTVAALIGAAVASSQSNIARASRQSQLLTLAEAPLGVNRRAHFAAEALSYADTPAARRQLLAATVGQPRRIWTARSDRPTRAITISSDGRIVATGHQDGLRLWDATSGALLDSVAAQTRNSAVRQVCFHPSGRELAWVDGEQAFHFDFATRKVLALVSDDIGAASLAYAAGGTSLVIGARKGFKIIAEGRIHQDFPHDDAANALGLQLSHRVVLGRTSSFLELSIRGLVERDLSTGRPLSRWETIPGTKSVSRPDGCDVQLIGSGDGRIVVQSRDGKPIGQCKTHRGRVSQLLPSADGAFFVSAGADGDVVVSDTLSLDELTRLHGGPWGSVTDSVFALDAVGEILYIAGQSNRAVEAWSLRPVIGNRQTLGPLQDTEKRLRITKQNVMDACLFSDGVLLPLGYTQFVPFEPDGCMGKVTDLLLSMPGTGIRVDDEHLLFSSSVNGLLQIFSRTKRRVVRQLGSFQPVRSNEEMAVSPDGTIAVLVENSRALARIALREKQEPLKAEMPTDVAGLTFITQDAVFTAGDELCLVDARSLAVLKRRQTPGFVPTGALAHRDGIVAIGAVDKVVFAPANLTDPEQPKAIPVPGHVASLAWSQDGHLLAIGTNSGEVQVVDRAGEVIYSLTQSGQVVFVGFRGPRQLVSVAETEIRLHDLSWLDIPATDVQAAVTAAFGEPPLPR